MLKVQTFIFINDVEIIKINDKQIIDKGNFYFQGNKYYIKNGKITSENNELN